MQTPRLFLCALALSVVLFGCGNASESKESPTKASPKVETPATTVVGEYKAEVDPAKVTKPEEKAGAEKMAAVTSLSIKADNTFVMSSNIALEGNWKLEGDKLALMATKMDGKADLGSGSRKITLTFKDNQLVPLAGDRGAPPIIFVRK